MGRYNRLLQRARQNLLQSHHAKNGIPRYSQPDTRHNLTLLRQNVKGQKFKVPVYFEELPEK